MIVTVMVHTVTGRIASVDYWLFREVLSEAKRSTGLTEKHREAIKVIEDALTASYTVP